MNVACSHYRDNLVRLGLGCVVFKCACTVKKPCKVNVGYRHELGVLAERVRHFA